jgi:hypothetical protein
VNLASQRLIVEVAAQKDRLDGFTPIVFGTLIG